MYKSAQTCTQIHMGRLSKTPWSSFAKCMMHLSSTCTLNERTEVQAYPRLCVNLLPGDVISQHTNAASETWPLSVAPVHPRLFPRSIDLLASCPHHQSSAPAACMPGSRDSNGGHGGGAQGGDCERGCVGTIRSGVKRRELSWPAHCTPGGTRTRREYSLCCGCAAAGDWTGGQRRFIMGRDAVV